MILAIVNLLAALTVYVLLVIYLVKKSYAWREPRWGFVFFVTVLSAFAVSNFAIKVIFVMLLLAMRR